METCGCADGFAKEATEIQNIQVADGDIAHGIPVSIFLFISSFPFFQKDNQAMQQSLTKQHRYRCLWSFHGYSHAPRLLRVPSK